MAKECRSCQGTGKHSVCHGSGLTKAGKICAQCRGSGVCPMCDGTGYVGQIEQEPEGSSTKLGSIFLWFWIICAPYLILPFILFGFGRFTRSGKVIITLYTVFILSVITFTDKRERHAQIEQNIEQASNSKKDGRGFYDFSTQFGTKNLVS